MSKTKAQMAKEIKELEQQRSQQYQRIQELDAERATEKEAGDAARDELSKRSLQLTKEQDRVITLEGELREKSGELNQTRRNLELDLRVQKDSVVRYTNLWHKSADRVRDLEKLLVHNGKAIGALSDLAADKYKNDELPF